MVEQLNLSPSAARARRYRKRQREGTRLIPLEIFDYEVEALVEYGLVDESHRSDRAQIAEGLRLLLFALSQNEIEWIESPA